MVKVNLKGVQVGFKVYEDGRYPAVLTSFKNTKTKKGEDRVMATFTFKGGAFDGQKISTGYNLGPDSLWAFKTDMVNAGVDPAELEDEAIDTDDVLKALIGQEVLLDVGHHPDPTNANKVYNDVRIIEMDADAWNTPVGAAAGNGKAK